MRIGVCSDVHGRHDRLLAVLGAMDAAGVDERWCLGDLAGGEPVTDELLGAARRLDLLIAGNHDAWALRPAPDESYDWPAAGACMANPGPVCGNPRDAASWWLTVDLDARVLRWHRTEFA